MAGSSANWGEADAHAGLGYPTGKRHAIRYLIGRVLWPRLREQVSVNRALLAELDVVRARLDEAELGLNRVRGDVDHHTTVLVRHEEPLDRHDFLLSKLEANVHQVGPALTDLVRQIDVAKDMFNLGHRQVLARVYDSLSEMRAELQAELQEVNRRREGWQAALDDVWLRLSQLDLFLTEARRAFPKPIAPEVLTTISNGFESLYPVFEEAFRGPYAVVKERVRGYVPDLLALPGPGPVLDIGCGRGELLTALAEAGIAAYGVDINVDYVDRCRKEGLDVRLEDARAHLRSLDPGSLAAVTAIHVVEHIPTDDLLELVELAAIAVRPGGLLIFETPNPENITVGSNSFYLDPTHERPIPPTLLAFLVESRGFSDVGIRRLSRNEQFQGLARPKPDDAWSEDLTPLIDAVNFHLFGPADYAVIGRRP
jgi:2-polyprenyl-3-methyl-5-hydroxy-6-metoxy-1,4-benzoquinol methylase